MSVLDVKKLKAVQERMVESTSGGGVSYLTQSKLGEATDIRVFPPLPSLGGLYFKEVNVFWINKKKYISRSTYGEHCVLQEEYDLAKARVEKLEAEGKPDRGLKKLVESEDFKSKKSFYIPVIHLKCEFNEDNELESMDIEASNGKKVGKVLECGSQIVMSINRIATNPRMANKTEAGIFDLEKGRNLIITKEGSGIDTKYGAQYWEPTDILNDPLFKEALKTENVPDVDKIVRSGIKSDAYLRSVARNYFYGEAMLSEDAEDKPASNASNGTAEKEPAKSRVTPKVRRGASVSEDDEVEAEDAQEPSEVKAGSGRPRNLADDLNNFSGDD